MRRFAKTVIVNILGSQVKRLIRKHQFQVVAVAGSVGKTSTKMAIARVLQEKYPVRYQEGNYNDLVSVPMIFFGHQMPSLINPFAWLSIFIKNELQISRRYPFEMVVVELGTDGPGQMAAFRHYLNADIGVMTGIAPEHMEYFDDLDAVATEELELSRLARKLIVNADLCEEKYLKTIQTPIKTYSLRQKADIQLRGVEFEENESSFSVLENGTRLFQATHEAIAEPLLYAAAAAILVAKEIGLTADEIQSGLRNVKPFSGRMQRLRGIHGSVIIDDTYNASPVAVKAALETLYRLRGKHKIAILGNMNELGKYSKADHENIGSFCDPKQLDLVVTIGPDANRYLAPSAEKQGCNVAKFDDPFSAGEFLKGIVKEGSIVLAKGSQNGVFAEEAVKLLLRDPADAGMLVRQSPAWLKQKEALRAK